MNFYYVSPFALFLMILPLGSLLSANSSRVEEPPFEILQEDGLIQIRQYSEMVVVETRVEDNYRNAGNIAFRRLFQYISGNNVSAQKIPMTAPVLAENTQGERIPMTAPVLAEEQEGNGWVYQFILPGDMSYEDAPRPTHSLVSLRRIPARTVAVIRYSGSWTESAMEAKTEELSEWLREQGLESISAPSSASFNPPWVIPMFRRNEVWVEISWNSPEELND